MAKAAVPRRFSKAVESLSAIRSPLARLETVRTARESLEALEAQSVREARAAGATWGDIGAIYGVSKQAAQQRFRRSS